MKRVALRALAEKATPGPWRQGNVEKYNVFAGTPAGEWLGHEYVVLRMNTHFPSHVADAEYIAAANPSEVIALLDEHDKLAQKHEHMRHRLQLLYLKLQSDCTADEACEQIRKIFETDDE